MVLDLQATHFWDVTGVNARDRVVLKFRHHGVTVDVVGMNAATATLVDRLGTHQRANAVLAPPGH